MEISISEEQLETIFAFADADGSGSIDMGEFRNALGAHPGRDGRGGHGASWIVHDADHPVRGVRDDRGMCSLCVHLSRHWSMARTGADGAFRCGPHAGRAFIAVVQSTFIAGSGFVTQMAAARKSSMMIQKKPRRWTVSLFRKSAEIAKRRPSKFISR